jgi:hypothetical protein
MPQRAEPVSATPDMLAASQGVLRAADAIATPAGLDLPVNTYTYQVRRAQAGGDQVLDELGNPKILGAGTLNIDRGLEDRVAPKEGSGDPVLRSREPFQPFTRSPAKPPPRRRNI